MNILKVSLQETIEQLARQGWSQRRIARELDIDRSTVGKYVGPKEASEAKPATISPDGSEASAAPAPGEEAEIGDAKPAISPIGSKAGRKSHCEVFRTVIAEAAELGLSAQRIYQDLVREQQFPGSYDSVKRFVRQLGATRELPFRRIEVEPGTEAQVDFGQGAWVEDEQGKRRRPPVLRAVLSCSRKGYTEITVDQKTESFLRALENGFRAWGGVPRTIVIDNFKAAVKHPDWYDPELNPKLRDFARHYGTTILPCRPGLARHKGKVEAGVKYAQNNALARRKFPSVAAQNGYLLDWEKTVADLRIHGTIRQQVQKVFLELEKPALLPLPVDLFPVFEEAPRSVHRDGHVEVKKAYYSVPPEYVGRDVWARWDSKIVRLFNHRMEVIAMHVRREPGKFCTDPAHIHDHKRTIIERGVEWMMQRAQCMGTGCAAWAQAMYAQRGIEGLRVLQGFLRLAEDYPIGQLERAARRALDAGCWRLRELKQLLEQPSPQTELNFVEQHPLIRDLAEYGSGLSACFQTDQPQPQVIDDPQ